MILGKADIGVIVSVFPLSLDAGDDDGEVLDRLAEEMWPTVKRIFGAEMAQRAVNGRPVGLVGPVLGPTITSALLEARA